MTNRLLLSALAICVSVTPLLGQEGQGEVLNLKAGKFQVSQDEDGRLSDNEIAGWPAVNGRYYGLVSLGTYPDAQQKETLESEGVRILEFLPQTFYSVSISEDADLSVLNTYGVASWTPFIPDFKWAADRSAVPSRAVREDDKRLVVLTPFLDISLGHLAAELVELGVDVLKQDETFRMIEAAVSVDLLGDLAETAAVQSIEWAYPMGEPENYNSRTHSRTRFISHDNNNTISYDGSGVSVGVQDDGIIGPHLDYHGRIRAQFTSANGSTDHADHVAGTVGGAGNFNPRHQGQAEGVDYYIYQAAVGSANDYNGLSNLPNHYGTYDISLISTSYSDGCNAGYTNRARTVDDQTYDYSRLLYVFSAGNSGTSNCGYGAGNVWGNITGGHKMGKNCITVGNLTSADNLSGSSSRGPAWDGRIKPDICAQGTNVTSTIANNTYDSYSGTSMSCPNVTGTMAVLYEAYEDVQGQEPRGGLMKAMVLNTAEDLGNPGPDFKHGWGRMNARRAFDIIENSTFFVNSLSASSPAATHQITVPSNASRLRVMLYWTDPAASVNATTALINDLDLKGVSPSMDTLLPYVLNHAPNSITLDDDAVPGEDHLNNMEQIEVMNPEEGTFTFTVSPYAVPVGPQEYYVVYYIEEDPLVITHPVGGERLAPFDSEIIRWDAEVEGSLSIEYSNDGGSNWTTINGSINAAQEYFIWTVPFMAQGDVQVRLVHDSATVVSNEFSIMTVPTNLSVAYACPDSIGLMWDPVGDAVSYDVYKLGSKYMDSLGTSTTNMFVDYLSDPYSDSLWYSVSSDGPDAAGSYRHIAVQKQPGLQNCFLANDLSAITLLPNISQIFPCYGEETILGFVVENTGVTPSSTFYASVTGPSGVVVADSFSTSIPPTELDTFYFSTAVNLDAGTNVYDLDIDMPGDQNYFNDSLLQAFLVESSDPLLPLWEEHFDQIPANCSDASDCGDTECPLPDGWINESNGIFDDIDWRVNSGTTPSTGTGPLGDNTSPGGGGKFVYLEASGGCTFQEASLLSPCIDLSQATEPLLTFYYNMYGLDMGELHVDVYDGTDWHLDVVPALSGNQGSQWRVREVHLDAFNGLSINVRFRGITGDDYRSDIALDDITITHPPVADFEYFTQPNGQTVLFNDYSAYADTMRFDLGDGTPELDSVPASHDYLIQQSYSVKQVVTNPYGADSLTLDIINLGLESGVDEKITLYPNPARTELVLDLSSASSVERIELWSIDGRKVMDMPVNSGEVRSVDVSTVANGTYHLRVIGESVIEKPIVVAH